MVVKLQLLDQEIALDEAFNQISDLAGRQAIIREISRRHTFQNCFEQYNIKLDLNNEEVKTALLSRFGTALNLVTPEAWDNFYQKSNLTKEQLIQQLAYQEQIESLKRTAIAPEAIKDLFLKMKTQLDQVLFALIRVSKEALAKEIYHRLIDDNQDFAELARKYSSGPEAQQGGIVGPKPLSALNPDLIKRLTSLEAGHISEPFALGEENYVIIKLIRLESAQLVPQLENNLRDRLFEEWLENQIKLVNLRVLN